MPTRAHSTKGSPSAPPPDVTTDSVSSDAPGLSAPSDLSDSKLAAVVASFVETAPAGPTLQPPAAVTGGVTTAAQAVTATWLNGLVVDALWSINETRNAWFHVQGGAWYKIYNGRDGAFTALLTLASQARQTGRAMNVRQEADGMVYEIYLW